MHRQDDLGGKGRREQLQEFAADALGRELRQALLQRDRCHQPDCIELALAVFGAETKEAKNTQVVFSNPGFRISDEPHAALAKIVEAADRIFRKRIGTHHIPPVHVPSGT